MASYRALAVCGFGVANLCWQQDCVSGNRIKGEVQTLSNMRNEALSLLSVASDEPIFSVWSTEKEIFERVCIDLESRLETRKAFQESTPILRLLSPSLYLERSLGEYYWNLAYHADGDAYQSFLKFYTRHVPNTVGSVVYQELLEGLAKKQ